MARKQNKTPRPERRAGGTSRFALPLLLALVQVAALPGLASVYRLPKTALAIAGLALIAGLGLARTAWRQRLTVPRSPLTVVLLVLPTWQLASAWWSAAPLRAVASGASSLVWVIAALWLSQQTPDDRRRALRWTAVAAAVSAAVIVIQTLGIPLFSFLAQGRRTLTGLAGNPSDLAIASVLLLPLLLAEVAPERASLGRLRLPLLLVVAVLCSQSFTGLLAVAAFTLTWALVKGSRQVRWTILGVLALTAAAVVIIDPGGRISKLRFQIGEGRWYIMMSAREDGWSAAAQMIRDNPLLGVGAGHYTHAYYPSRLQWLEDRDLVGGRGELATHFSWAHCDPLQLGAELGVVGWLWLAALTFILHRYRRRLDPLVTLFAVAFVPFALLHYPSHLAVGGIPLLLFLATLLAEDPRQPVPMPSPLLRGAVALALVSVAVVTASWQVKRLALSAWRANIEAALAATEAAPTEQRGQLAAVIEMEAARTLPANPGAAGWILRLTGKARLLRGDATGAVEAFTAAWQRWPHEEAEFGLGIALAELGRRQEALLHLGRVCRTNPKLAGMIADTDLRRSVRVISRRRSERAAESQ